MKINSNQYKHPEDNLFSGLIELLSNTSRLKKIRRSIFNILPFLKMKSEVRDIVYVNWLVDINKAKKLLPDNLELIDIDGKTLFTVLSYQHGNFRPSFLSFIRAIFPSPYQSNWRFYLSSCNGDNTTNSVFFLKNIMSSLPYSLGTRIFSDAMQTHLAKKFEHSCTEGRFSTRIESGRGSAPEISCMLENSEKFNMPSKLVEYFGSIEKVLSYLCLQDFAFSDGEDFNGLCKAEIKLPIDIQTVSALKIIQVKGDWFSSLVADAEPFAFFVPKVDFEVVNETLV